MRVAFHITFYFSEKRLVYLNQVIEGLNKIPGNNIIFIYTNHNLRGLINNPKSNIKVIRYHYDLKILKPFYNKYGRYPYEHWSRKLGLTFFTHPYYLTWESRKYMAKMADDFDAQMYLEDDVLFTDVNFSYWLENKDLCLKHNHNLGFLRYESDPQTGDVFYSDLTEPVTGVIYLEDKPFWVNYNNPYYAFWIMDKQELKGFIASPQWNLKRDKFYGEREISAIGWHGKDMTRYTNTIVPLQSKDQNTYRFSDGALVHHLPNSYINHHMFCTIKHPFDISKP
jgi:hypothetical protein